MAELPNVEHAAGEPGEPVTECAVGDDLSAEQTAEEEALGGVVRQPAVGVRFGPGEQTVYYKRGRFTVALGDSVVAQVDRGMDIGTVTSLPELPTEQVKGLPTLLRRANGRDLERQAGLDARRKEGLATCRHLIEAHNLPMRLIDCHCTLDGRRLVFYFASETRVDFRELVRDLAREFRCRIELRQVGVRDHARMLGGLGPCGRPLCCAQFLRAFEPVSIRAAKDQGIALNPGKLSGLCDRLMCCLLYEHSVYKELGQNMPKVGSHIETPNGPAKVESINILTHTINVWLEEGRRASFQAGDLGYGPACGCGSCAACVRVAEAEKAKNAPPPPVEAAAPAAEGEADASGEHPAKPRRRRRRRKKSGGGNGANGDKPPASGQAS